MDLSEVRRSNRADGPNPILRVLPAESYLSEFARESTTWETKIAKRAGVPAERELLGTVIHLEVTGIPDTP